MWTYCDKNNLKLKLVSKTHLGQSRCGIRQGGHSISPSKIQYIPVLFQVYFPSFQVYLLQIKKIQETVHQIFIVYILQTLGIHQA